MRNSVKDIDLDTRFELRIRAMRQKGINEANKRGMDISRALGSKGKKDVIRVNVMFSAVSMLRIARDLSSLRMSGLIR